MSKIEIICDYIRKEAVVSYYRFVSIFLKPDKSFIVISHENFIYSVNEDFSIFNKDQELIYDNRENTVKNGLLILILMHLKKTKSLGYLTMKILNIRKI